MFMGVNNPRGTWWCGPVWAWPHGPRLLVQPSSLMSFLRLIWPCGPFQRRPLFTTGSGGSAASLITHLINIALLRLYCHLMDTPLPPLVLWCDRLDLLQFQLFAWLARGKKVTGTSTNHWVCDQQRPESPHGWCHVLSFCCRRCSERIIYVMYVRNKYKYEFKAPGNQLPLQWCRWPVINHTYIISAAKVGRRLGRTIVHFHPFSVRCEKSVWWGTFVLSWHLHYWIHFCDTPLKWRLVVDGQRDLY